MRILAQIPGLLARLPESKVDNFRSFSTVIEGSEEVLVDMNIQVPKDQDMKLQSSLGMKPVLRAAFHQ